MANVNINFDSKKLERLKVAYEKARKEGVEVFTFDNREYVVDYAKYLIQYLESIGL